MSPRDWIRIAAMALAAAGLMCLPSTGTNPKRLTSLFHAIADTGVWFELGIWLLVAAALLGLSTVRWTRRNASP